ncbi:hypothetical protein FRC09_003705 [Ceratobasidium sp. 395]|nr:hypothetical protein FRC09_003705 [Ceratobasidium sp. 395]
MLRSLPVELLTLIAGLMSQPTLANLALTSKTTYAVSIAPLYTSIPSMNALRTVQSLGTLAMSTFLAQLVRSCSIDAPIEDDESGYLSELVAAALKNMTGLTELSLRLGPSFSSVVLQKARFRLRKLVCVIVSAPEYPVARFLNYQHALESLYLDCAGTERRFSSLLSPKALPILKDISAPPQLLLKILPRRLCHITSISSLGTIIDPNVLGELIMLFHKGPTSPTTPVECILGLDFSAPTWRQEIVARALSLLGQAAPWIGSLRLEVHRGRVEQDFLLRHLTQILSNYPSLHTLAIISEPQSRIRAYMRPNPLSNTTQHMLHLNEWRGACPTLKLIVFPNVQYKYTQLPANEKERALSTGSWSEADVGDLPPPVRLSEPSSSVFSLL